MSSEVSELRVRYNDVRRGVYFIGTTPPKSDVPLDEVENIGQKLLARLHEIDFDGLIVYDLQDENSRIKTERPFPFKSAHDTRLYSSILNKISGRPVITYKSVSQFDADQFQQWCDEAWTDFNVREVVLVGSPSAKNKIALSLNAAYESLKANKHDFFAGGITIAERHAKKGDEHLRLIKKYEDGCSFFVSQAIYNPQATIDLLTRYAVECKRHNTPPQRILLTFSPCGSSKTLEFIEWLGISVPEATTLRILNATNPLQESIRICRNSLEQILEACVPLGLPLGLNIESLTNRKEEIDGSILLYKLLRSTMDLKLAEHQLGLS